MTPEDRRRLEDMLRYAGNAIDFVSGRDGAAIENDVKSLMAVVGALILLGEAAAQLSEPLRKSLPDVPWRQAKDLRNLLVHRYFEINANRLVETVHDHLPKLITDLRAILVPGPSTP